MATTKYDIGEKVFIRGEICGIMVNDKGEITYKVCIDDNSDRRTCLTFDEEQIIKNEENEEDEENEH